MNDFERRAQRATRAIHERSASLSGREKPVRARNRGLVAGAVVVVLAIAGLAFVLQRDSGDGDSPLATSTSARADRAVEILNQFVNGQYEDITRDFTPAMAADASVAELESAWAELQSALGGYQTHGRPSETTLDGKQVVMLPLTMDEQKAILRVDFTSDGHVAGLVLHRLDAGQVATAEALTRLISDERWDEVRMRFNEQMLEAVSEQELIAVWAEAKRNGGDLLGIGSAVIAAQDGTNIAYDTPLDFARADAKTRITFDQSNRVSGLFIVPA